PGSHPTALEVCNARGCRQGLPESSSPSVMSAYEAALLARGGEHALPIGHAASAHDARGDAVVVHAAPVSTGQPLIVRVTYACAVPMHGGVLRLSLPASGMDPQAARSEVRLSAAGLLDARIADVPATDHGASFDPW